MKNLIFIYGDDTFRAVEYVKFLKAKFCEKNKGLFNLTEYDLEDKNDFNAVMVNISTIPFLATNRLIVIKHALKAKDAPVEQFTRTIKNSQSTIVVFFERGFPDKRTKFYKYLAQNAVKKEFKELAPWQQKEWIKRQFAKEGKTIDQEALEYLVRIKQGKISKILPEIKKLIFVSQPTISLIIIKKLVAPSYEDKLYEIYDSFLSENCASHILKKIDHIKINQSEFFIWGTIVNLFRNLLLIANESNKNPFILQKKLGISYFLAQKAFLLKKDFTQLKKFYQMLFDYDVKVKTGKIELKLALDLTACKFCEL
ncbi:hypothetical protein CO101_01470 [Candidatus Berkelbacteria bacterium CG_4_9_14_3_um_filter_39_23]|uniref:DNA polymerase III delta N-terminal domain-containing protein n=2 Tax=Candidatus Berkelbacteria TaxID=1618330 RepID=A0A2M7CID6_9BACT|nr:hypothetical protein [Candidatus Berkelbacteria bacterium]OIP06010.1 MAG: hypothetical protein AUK14_00495 [Candidatus Berkelbacteria bacterium CG2_30_39_44]PIR27697.1 MAG: hypothetical protein COV39_03115 [Candidatus Berkelbacteria bacterium CG11_big_fil_rev_8_21_14_0_20_40_23]PIV25368.1 MAG: hypothetical protein COS38_01955 [Candidatus Berkelbacteria bacterium CG03_land_8_20_14_0_80_40_36]PIX30896.1 MAG: hypothetical protein COZ62_00155 [Candidatus Berkelbacteria bacterium CG_4_8_14_3_um_f